MPEQSNTPGFARLRLRFVRIILAASNDLGVGTHGLHVRAIGLLV